jgi:hypothetical protein
MQEDGVWLLPKQLIYDLFPLSLRHTFSEFRLCLWGQRQKTLRRLSVHSVTSAVPGSTHGTDFNKTLVFPVAVELFLGMYSGNLLCLSPEHFWCWRRGQDIWRSRGLCCWERTSNYSFFSNALLPGLLVLIRQLMFRMQKVNVVRASSVTLHSQ